MVYCAPRRPYMAKKKAGSVRVPRKLTEAEQDLVWHMEHGYLTDLLGSNPVLRRKDDEVIRPGSANRNTVKALEEQGLIVPSKGRDALTIVWRIRANHRNNRSAAGRKNASAKRGSYLGYDPHFRASLRFLCSSLAFTE